MSNTTIGFIFSCIWFALLVATTGDGQDTTVPMIIANVWISFTLLTLKR